MNEGLYYYLENLSFYPMELFVYMGYLGHKGEEMTGLGIWKWNRSGDHRMETEKSTDFCLSVFIYLNIK